MSYESAPQTKMLATECCICGKELCDAKSVEVGIGPECRRKHGYTRIDELSDEARVEANKLVYQIAMDRRNVAVVVPACQKLFSLGFTQLVRAVCKGIATVKIDVSDDKHPHGPGRLILRTPYSEFAVERMRRVPGRRWYGEKDATGFKHNTFPQSSKGALYQALSELYAGEIGIGPKGPFVVAQRTQPAKPELNDEPGHAQEDDYDYSAEVAAENAAENAADLQAATMRFEYLNEPGTY